MICKELRRKLEKISESSKIIDHGKTLALTCILKKEFYGDVEKILRETLHRDNCEIIVNNIKDGTIFDSGEKYIVIVKGIFYEFYDYDKKSCAFIRLYHLKLDEKEWLALYVDENIDCIWWKG